MEVKSKVAERKRMVSKLYDRLVIPETTIMTIMPGVHAFTIWAIPDLVEENREERIERKKTKHQISNEKEVIKKAEEDILQSEQDQPIRV